MAWRIPSESVLRGVMDNTRKGVVSVELWLCGKEEPMRLTLIGHPHRDMAGCRVEFVRRVQDGVEEQKDFELNLPMVQHGRCGDISASMKRRIPEVPLDEVHRLEDEGLPVPCRMENTVYLEWYTDAEGRLVLEGDGMDITTSEPHWTMTEEDERQAQEGAAAAIQGYVDHLSGSEVEVVEDREMDEFEWEEWLKERDRRTDALGELLEKFGHDTDGWDQAAKYMGWTLGEKEDSDDDESSADEDIIGFSAPDEPLESWQAEDSEDGEEDEEEDEDLLAQYEERDNPIGKRVRELLNLRRKAKPRSADGEDEFGPAEQFDFALMKLSAKLAGALNGLSTDGYRPEAGMTIALLKRTLLIVDEAMAQFDAAAVPHAQRDEVFSIREDILDRISSLRRGDG